MGKEVCTVWSALLYQGRRRGDDRLIPGSSAVEQAAVNRLAGGSNPSPGANKNKELGCNARLLVFI